MGVAPLLVGGPQGGDDGGHGGRRLLRRGARYAGRGHPGTGRPDHQGGPLLRRAVHGDQRAADLRGRAVGLEALRQDRSTDMTYALKTDELTKIYGTGEASVTALDKITLEIREERFTAIMGPSGSGKSTLMHCLAGLDGIDGGEVWLGDTALSGLNDRGLTTVRREQVGFIFQQFNLLPMLTALENITLPLTIAGREVDREFLADVVAAVGLGDRLDHRPSELSGGQQQRVACARALLPRPQVVFADEPTGNLDSRSGLDVLRFLAGSPGRFGQTVVMVTHDPQAAAFADRVVFLADGRLAGELHAPTVDGVHAAMRELEAA
ncbi:ABC transporter ATP-binding protein [Pseudonocardiaceae bacterium YIM PH 21723]|nr:ABC transporter ATP-binding protein [Pseudonocardiaceae bacterium YIM PH 21723]